MKKQNCVKTKTHALMERIGKVKLVSVKKIQFVTAACPACGFESRMEVDGSEIVAATKVKTLVLKHVLAEHKALAVPGGEPGQAEGSKAGKSPPWFLRV